MIVKKIEIIDEVIYLETNLGKKKFTKNHPHYEGMRLQVDSLGINSWKWDENLKKYSPQRPPQNPPISDSVEEYWVSDNTGGHVFYDDYWNQSKD